MKRVNGVNNTPLSYSLCFPEPSGKEFLPGRCVSSIWPIASEKYPLVRIYIPSFTDSYPLRFDRTNYSAISTS